MKYGLPSFMRVMSKYDTLRRPPSILSQDIIATSGDSPALFTIEKRRDLRIFSWIGIHLFIVELFMKKSEDSHLGEVGCFAGLTTNARFNYF